MKPRNKQKYKFYHEENFHRIQKLVSDNRLEVASVKFEQYLQEYPNDVCGCAYYADLLIKMGRFQEAATILDDAPVTSKTPELARQDIILTRIKLFSSLGQYEKCLEMIRNNFEMLECRNWNVTELLIFFKKKLGLLLYDDYSGFNYKISQITGYSEEAAIECIRRYHLVNYGRTPHYCFYDDFPINEVYYKVRNMLPLEEKIYENVFENTYIFKYANNGRVFGESVDYIKVITLMESNDIITMLPYKNTERVSCIDLTPVVEEYPKVKRMSQIDKFNQRYGKIVDKR